MLSSAQDFERILGTSVMSVIYMPNQFNENLDWW